MTSLAWSSLVLLGLLLPGFFYFVGLYASEKFARDVTPKNPLATLGTIVVVTLLSHLMLSSGLGLVSLSVDWTAVLDAIHMAPPVEGGLSAAERVGKHLEGWGLAKITGYVGLSCMIGLGCGIVVGRQVAAGRFHAIAVQHPWVYPVQPGDDGVMTYAHVLTTITHGPNVLLYRGRLKHFSLAADGTFAYVVIAASGQRLLRLDREIPELSDVREIGSSTTLPREDHASDGALMMIPAATIRDVVFQGQFRPRDLTDSEELADELLKGIGKTDDPEGELRVLDEFAGEDPASADRKVVGMSTHDVQEALKKLNYDPGPSDGRPGPRTRRAVRSFQQNNHLHPDGNVGPITEAELRRRIAAHAADGPRTENDQG